MKPSIPKRVWPKRLALMIGFWVSIFLITNISLHFSSIAGATTTAFNFLIIVLFSAFFGDIYVAIAVSLVAGICFDYFFLPPFGTFTITAFPDVIAFVAFLFTSIIISYLTSSASTHAENAKTYSKASVGLKEFGAWLSSVPDDQVTLSIIAQKALEVFGLEYCSVREYGIGKWNHFSGTAARDISQEIENSSLKYINDHPTDVMEFADENILGVRYSQVYVGRLPRALFAVKGDSLPAAFLDIIAHAISLRLSQTVMGK